MPIPGAEVEADDEEEADDVEQQENNNRIGAEVRRDEGGGEAGSVMRHAAMSPNAMTVAFSSRPTEKENKDEIKPNVNDAVFLILEVNVKCF